MDLVLRALPAETAADDVELVEHKGIGHPDTMCDAMAEELAVALAHHYVARFGRVLHFNVDKALLVGGQSRPAFRGGEVTTPIHVFLAGRATREVGATKIPVDEIAIESAKAWVRRHMHALDPDQHVVWSPLVRGGSTELVDMFGRAGARAAPWVANDTSLGAGYAPLSSLERVVLAAGERLRALSRETPEVGEDVKVMGVRRGERMHLTVACAFVGAHLRDLDDYAARRDVLRREVSKAAGLARGGDVTVEVNAADDLAARRVYLTVTGTSAEAGDDGEVGRGNRVNGLITPYRPMTLEAAAGKNPVSHVGKLYNVLAHRIAAAIVAEVPDVAEARCFLVSTIGRPVDDPSVVDVQVRTRGGVPVEAVRGRVLDVARAGVATVETLADEIVAGRVRLY